MAKRLLHDTESVSARVALLDGIGHEMLEQGGQRGGWRAVGAEQTGQPEMPEIMAVARELRQPLTKAKTREANIVILAARVGNDSKRNAQQQNQVENPLDDIGAVMLVGHEEIGRKADRAAARLTDKPVDTEFLVGGVRRNDMPWVAPEIPYTTAALIKRTLLRTRRPHFLPMINVVLDIGAERTILSAWVSWGFMGCHILRCVLPITPRNLFDKLNRIPRHIS